MIIKSGVFNICFFAGSEFLPILMELVSFAKEDPYPRTHKLEIMVLKLNTLLTRCSHLAKSVKEKLMISNNPLIISTRHLITTVFPSSKLQNLILIPKTML